MAKTKIPTHQPNQLFPSAADELHQEGNWLWIPLRKEWRDVTNKPEEIVRQKFIRALVEHYGYALGQLDQERRTQHGHKSPRADIVVWQSADDKAASRSPALVVECKTDTIEIQERDYYQGEPYTRATGCEFFVATNIRHTAIFKLVPGFPGEFIAINEIPKASDWGDAKRLKEIRESLRTFNRKEFQDLLFVCHSILRDVHKMDPGRAFDTISKILFIAQRNDAHAEYASRNVSGEDAAVEKLLKQLAPLGISRVLPGWTAGAPPAYPRAGKPTAQGRPVWQGEAAKEHKKTATELRRKASTVLKGVEEHIAALFSELKAKYRAIDEAHTAALWARVRELFDYPVFVAAPKAVGITSTGETGEGVPNELPNVLEAFSKFDAWIKAGMSESEAPEFAA